MQGNATRDPSRRSIGLVESEQDVPLPIARSFVSPALGPLIRRGLGTIGALAAILSLAAYLRLKDLAGFPPPLHVDEAASGLNGLKVVDGALPLFSYGFTHHPNTAFVVSGLTLKLFGASAWSLRIPEVAFGLGAVLLTYLLGRSLFSHRIGLAAALLMAVNHFALAFSRIGLVNQQSMTVELLAFWLLWEGFNRRRRALIFLGGVAAGLGLFLYFASWIVPVILGCFVLWAALFRRPEARKDLRLGLWGALGFVLAVLPLALFLASGLQEFQGRPSEVFMLSNLDAFKAFWRTESLLEVVGLQTWSTVRVFVLGGDTSTQYGNDAPLLSPLMRPFFVLGLIIAAWRAFRRQGPSTFLLLWGLLTLAIGGILTDYPPFMPRLIGVIPAALLIAALGLAESASVLQSLALRRGFPGERLRVSAASGPAATAITLAALGIVGLYGLSWHHQAYFTDYPKAPRVIWWPWIEPMSSIGRYLKSQNAESQAYLFHVSDGYTTVDVSHPSLQFYLYGKHVRLQQTTCSADQCSIPSPATSGETTYILPAGAEDLLEQVREKAPGGELRVSIGPINANGDQGVQFLAYCVANA